MLRPLRPLTVALLLACSEEAATPPGRGGSGGSIGSGGSGGSAGGNPGGSGGTGGSVGGGTGGSSGAAGGTGGSSGAGGKGDAGATGGSGGTRGMDAGSSDLGAARDAAVDGAATVTETGGAGKFSFFVTSLGAMRRLSGSQDGFGGDLRHGEATGLGGADRICTEIAEMSMPGAGAKQWRAFLSTTRGGPNDGPVHAIDRVGAGPWYDRLGRLVAANKEDLAQPRPRGADPAIINDLPNEHGIPNGKDGAPGCVSFWCPDNHDILTGTNDKGMLYSTDPASTCNDWTNAERWGKPWCGHSWPLQESGVNWMSSVPEGGCAPGVNLVQRGGARMPTVGSGGGYGGIYCFALTP